MPTLPAIRIRDTLTGEVRPLETRAPGGDGIYVCGPTVYGRIHVGNARPYVMFALLKRFLEHEGYEVRTAMIGTRGEEIFRTWRPDVVITTSCEDATWGIWPRLRTCARRSVWSASCSFRQTVRRTRRKSPSRLRPRASAW